MAAFGSLRRQSLFPSLLSTLWLSTAVASTPIASTINDFFQPGTQPNTLTQPIYSPSTGCALCHGAFEEDDTKVWKEWQGSMMAQSARDPLFYACLAIANQDSLQSGDLCIRCHAPKAWLEGRSTPTDASAFMSTDRDGVSCFFCHRLVDPVYQAGVSPVEDVPILAALTSLPVNPHSGNYVIDPLAPPQPDDFTGMGGPRRGPFADPFQGYPGAEAAHPYIYSPFHSRAELCATCHDVSNPLFTRQANGTYALNSLDAAHETQNKYDMFPIERTYSEWAHSAFPAGVNMGGVFGGNLLVVRTCQDCHMPDSDGAACNLAEGTYRTDLPAHHFSGGNAWVQSLLVGLWPQDFTTPGYAENLASGAARSVSMLQRAAVLGVSFDGPTVTARITNRSGHKLPTGYGEGRRMWVNVQFSNAAQQLIAERGAYNSVTGVLSQYDTKVYEARHGMDRAVAALSGNAPGASFHFVLNNTTVKDNRIPPLGFTNAGFAAAQAEPVGAAYADGQNWDDTSFNIPRNAASATVTIYYQTASKEYLDFLRDANVTNIWGDTLHQLWQNSGMSPPVMMASRTIAVVPNGDGNGDGHVNLPDCAPLYGCLTGPNAGALGHGCGPFDFNYDSDVDLFDLADFQTAFGN